MMNPMWDRYVASMQALTGSPDGMFRGTLAPPEFDQAATPAASMPTVQQPMVQQPTASMTGRPTQISNTAPVYYPPTSPSMKALYTPPPAEGVPAPPTAASPVTPVATAGPAMGSAVPGAAAQPPLATMADALKRSKRSPAASAGSSMSVLDAAASAARKGR